MIKKENNMICFEVLDELDEILFEDEVHLDFEDLKIFLVECEVEDNNLKVLIWRIYFEICEDNNKDKSQKKNQLV
jgi:hypothetical protein